MTKISTNNDSDATNTKNAKSRKVESDDATAGANNEKNVYKLDFGENSIRHRAGLPVPQSCSEYMTVQS
eukprot:scaffold78124_cov25-Prasinocladus_malaysianus.AAC.1